VRGWVGCQRLGELAGHNASGSIRRAPTTKPRGASHVTDLTVYLAHTPEAERIALHARTDVDRRCTGVAYSRLCDERGAIGHSLQSLFIDSSE